MCKNIVDLPNSFSELTTLTGVDLQGCERLTQLPESIGFMSHLRTLKLADCRKLRELPSSISQLALLHTINLQGCGAIKRIPDSIVEMKSLRFLQLGGCHKLEVLPPLLGSLELLQTLDLHWCMNLADIPCSVGTLTSLVALDLRRCLKVVALPQSIKGLECLRTLNLSFSKLDRLPDEIGNLSTIWTLELQECDRLTELPESIEKLVELRTLNLRLCRNLRRLPEFTSLAPLTALEKLDLAHCSTLRELPVWIGKLGKQLQSIDVHGCLSMATPPQHTVQMGSDAVLQFMKDLAKGSICCYAAKVVLLGDQRSGKSSLLDSLEREEPASRAYDDRTVGIDVRRVKKNDTVINFYDAAGHEVYRASHGMFMSADAMFVHVVRSNTSEKEAVDALLSWIEAVNHEVPGAVMGVVWTHLDCSKVNQESVLQSVQQKLAIDDEALNGAMQDLEDEAVKLPHDEMSDRARESYEELDQKWHQVRVQRDNALKTLHSASMIGMKTAPKGSEMQDSFASFTIKCPQGHSLAPASDFDSQLSCNGASCADESAHAEIFCHKCNYGLCRACVPVSSAIQGILDSTLHLKHLHAQMEDLEKNIDKFRIRNREDHSSSTAQPANIATPQSLFAQYEQQESTGSLRRLRKRAMMRPRILFSHSMSSKTGQGLSAFKKSLWNLIEDQRLFPHVGMKVPLNYAMLGALADRTKSKDAFHGFTVFRGKWADVNVSESATLGLKWQNIGNASPDAGRVLENSELAEALTRTIEFSHQEWEAFGIKNLRITDFVKSGDSYFNPADTRTIQFNGNLCTMFSKFTCPLGCKAYYELEVLKFDTHPQYGFTTENFKRHMGFTHLGVGEDNQSWSFDGANKCKRHQVSEKVDIEWKVGDVVGLACDLDSMQIMVSVNGSFSQHTFTIERGAGINGLFPAFTGKEGKVRYNLGEEPFKHKPPSETFKAFCDYEVSFPLCDLAFWEIAVAKHVETRATDNLRVALASPCVPMKVLEQECAQVGIYKKELDSALRFLHATGSMLHYGTKKDKKRFGWKVQNTVIVQPQFVIDAIKYMIRESIDGELNDELRAMDALIRRNASEKAELDKFLGLTTSGAGILSKHLLTHHLWKKIPKTHHGLLLELLTGFKLLRMLTQPNAPSVIFLVPAMLSKDALPLSYVGPWWCPPMCKNAAGMKDGDGTTRMAAMRVKYRTLVGRLPLNFMTDLQVSLSQSRLEAEDRFQHYSSEAAVVDRLGGSVLSITYKCGGGNVREWVVISRSQEQVDERKASSRFLFSDYINVMGWVEFAGESPQGKTDWRLLRGVIEEINLAQKRTASLVLDMMLVYVDAEQRLAKPEIVTRKVLKEKIVTFEFEDQSEKVVDVTIDLETVFPCNAETTLVKRSQSSSEGPRISSLAKQVDAFFAKTVDDTRIDVHQEGQILMRTILDAGTGWKCDVHPQPTIDDLFLSIETARERNLRLCHLAGHGTKKGFVWNASESATAAQHFEPAPIARKLGAISGANGPLHGVLLNACSTYEFGKLLIEHGVPFVVCWKTEVQDETARELSRHFYRAVVDQKKHAYSVKDYQNAFLEATDLMRASAYTKGFSKPLKSSLPTMVTMKDTAATRNSPSSVASDSTVVPAKDPSSPVRQKVTPWNSQDVIVFLSQEGEIEPIYLWRESCRTERPTEFEPELKVLFEEYGLNLDICASLCKELGVENVGDMKLVQTAHLDRLPWLNDTDKIIFKERLGIMIKSFEASKVGVSTMDSRRAAGSTKRVYAFQTKEQGDPIGVHAEVQRVLISLLVNCDTFDIISFPMTTFDDFKARLLDCADKNVIGVWFSGHAGEGGKLCFVKDYDAVETEMLGPDIVAPPVGRACRPSTRGEGVEFVLLNSCHTRPLGLQMRKEGVPHVVCWRGNVEDRIASKFAEWFFKELMRSPSEYRRAFDAGREEVKRLQESCADDLSFLSENQADEVDPVDDEEESAEVRFRSCYSGDSVVEDVQDDEQGDADNQQKRVDRMANNVKGFHEIRGLKELGFHRLLEIERGIEMYERSGLSTRELREYGLEESAWDLYKGNMRVAGKKMLFISDRAVTSISEGAAHSYLDLWRIDGVVEEKIEHAKPAALASAKWHFEESLSVRKRQSHGRAPNRSHQAMIDGLSRCIQKIITVSNRLEDERKQGKTKREVVWRDDLFAM